MSAWACSRQLGLAASAISKDKPTFRCLSFMFVSPIPRAIFRRSGSVVVSGDSADKALIFGEALAQDNHAIRRDFIFTNIFGMISTPHFDHHHDLAKLAIDGHIPQPEDVIAKE
jgi:hypothetical protein